MTITINLDTILDRIYAESAWHAAYSTTIPVLTPDNARLLEMRIEDGLADIKARISAYVTQWNFNPHLDEDHITIGLALPATMDSQQDTIAALIVEALAQYALMRFYNDEQLHFAAAWRVARARLTILLSRTQ